MFVSTSTNIHFWVPGGRIAPVEECVERCMKAGFTHFDANFCDNATTGQPLTMDNWESWAEGLRRHADSIGADYPIAHAPFYNVCEPESQPINDFFPGKERQEELVRRAIISCGILGVKWIVFHAGMVTSGGIYDDEASLEKNLEYFRPWLAFAKQHGVGIALENLVGLRGRGAHYVGRVKNLIQLVDAFDDPAVGICWDFGHANMTIERQVDSLRLVGKRLKVTHVADNHGQTDEHVAPYLGTVPWNEILPVLGEIGYEGGFNYEIHNQMRNLPDAVRDAQLKYLYELACHMVSLAK